MCKSLTLKIWSTSVLRVPLTVAPHQQLGDLELVLLGSDVQRSPSEFRFLVGVGATLQQQLSTLVVAMQRSVVKGSPVVKGFEVGIQWHMPSIRLQKPCDEGGVAMRSSLNKLLLLCF